MDFDLSKAQKLLQQSARDFFSREYKPERVRELMATETAFDNGLWRAMADQGWMGLTIPEEHGGLGLSLVDLKRRDGARLSAWAISFDALVGCAR
jgi:alkylation response protein AidB-like acyl-CoA dehydrogenase